MLPLSIFIKADEPESKSIVSPSTVNPSLVTVPVTSMPVEVVASLGAPAYLKVTAPPLKNDAYCESPAEFLNIKLVACSSKLPAPASLIMLLLPSW